MIVYTGHMRVHFNRHGAAPLVWCVATDGWELAVSTVRIEASAKTMYEPKPTPDDEDGKPSAWLAVHGTLRLVGSIATIYTVGLVPQ